MLCHHLIFTCFHYQNAVEDLQYEAQEPDTAVDRDMQANAAEQVHLITVK